MKGIKTQTLASFLTFISAAGDVIMDVIILKGKAMQGMEELLTTVSVEKVDHGYATRSTSKWHHFYAVTDTGYVKQELFGDVMRKFVHVWNEQHPGLMAWVFGDQLGSHIEENMI